VPDRRKEFKQRLTRMTDEEIEELADDLVDFADRKGTGSLRNFIVDPRLRVILADMDKTQLRAAIRGAAKAGAVTTGMAALMSGLVSGPAGSVGAATTKLPVGLAGGYAAGRRKAKGRQVAEVLRHVRDRAAG